MGGAVRGVAPWKRLALLVFSYVIAAYSDKASGAIPSGRGFPLQHGVLFSTSQYSASRPHGSLRASGTYGFLDSPDAQASAGQLQDSNLGSGQDSLFQFEELGVSQLPTASGKAPGAERLFAGRKGAALGGRTGGAYQSISALQVAEQPQEEGEASDDSNASSEEDQQKEGSEKSHDGENSTTENAENYQSTSSANESGSAESSVQPKANESAGSAETTQQEPKTEESDESKAAEPKDEAKEEEEEEPEEGNNQSGKASSETQAPSNEQQPVAASQNGATGGAPAPAEEAGSSAKDDTTSSSDEGFQAGDSEKGEAAADSSAEKEQEASEDEGQRQPAKKGEKETAESASETSESEGSSQPSKEPEPEKNESGSGTDQGTQIEAAPATSGAEAGEQPGAGTPPEGVSAGSAAMPAEESRPEGVEGATKREAPASDNGGKCYSDIAQEALAEEGDLVKKAAANVHFEEVDQAFCDEIFRRIDGPYSLAELSALLRAADVADSRHRNFRYCRATSTSSPPRVKDGDSILHAAIAARKPQVTELLLQYGAFPELPAIPQSKGEHDKNVASPLLALNTAESTNARPMHAVAAIQALDSLESMELLLQYGASANSRDTLGRTPLMVAAYHLKPHAHEFVKKLILSGADVSATDKARMGALHYAAASDNWQVIRILLDHGADPAAADVRGNTPLHYAAAFNTYNATTKLLEKAEGGLSINISNANGKAPLHLAASPESFQAVPRPIVPALALEALLLHHANPMVRDAEGNNPLHLAARGGYVEILRCLIAMTNIPAEEKNAAGQTPLVAAQQAMIGPIFSEIERFLQVYSEKKGCIEPPLVRHSTRIFSDTVLGPYMRVGDTVTYTCNPGFSMFGHPTVICQERDGKMEFVPTAPLCLLSKESSAASPWPVTVGLIAAFALSAALIL